MNESDLLLFLLVLVEKKNSQNVGLLNYKCTTNLSHLYFNQIKDYAL